MVQQSDSGLAHIDVGSQPVFKLCTADLRRSFFPALPLCGELEYQHVDICWS